MEITGKVALVSGGASGIGLAIAEELLKNGVKGVVIVDINADAGPKVSSGLRKKYGRQKVIFQKTDVSDQKSYEDAFKAVTNLFGQLDIVVNNAAIVNDVNYEKQTSINLVGVMHGTSLAVKYMSKENNSNGGIVLSISSVAALDLFELLPFYSATKAGVMNLMRGYGNPLHVDKTGIRMMALLPGATMDTNLFADMKSITNDAQKLLANMTLPVQMSVSVGRAAIHVLKNGETGSVHVIEGSKLFLLNIPKWETYATVVKENLDLEL